MILQHVPVLLVVTTADSVMVVLMVMMEGRRGRGWKDEVTIVHVVHGGVDVTALERRREVLHQLRLGVAFGISGKSNKNLINKELVLLSLKFVFQHACYWSKTSSLIEYTP